MFESSSKRIFELLDDSNQQLLASIKGIEYHEKKGSVGRVVVRWAGGFGGLWEEGTPSRGQPATKRGRGG